MRVTIYWKTTDRDVMDKIRKRFDIPRYTSINGETHASICEEDIPLLSECEKRGFIQIREKPNKGVD